MYVSLNQVLDDQPFTAQTGFILELLLGSPTDTTPSSVLFVYQWGTIILSILLFILFSLHTVVCKLSGGLPLRVLLFSISLIILNGLWSYYMYVHPAIKL